MVLDVYVLIRLLRDVHSMINSSSTWSKWKRARSVFDLIDLALSNFLHLVRLLNFDVRSSSRASICMPEQILNPSPLLKNLA